ncbi:MAG TPA: hypothetical protein VH351_23805 [Bryobacteraceae bacterium]|jgi:hypothetical protein|nr:hypothetical protein [Bryobacteraceae bacterium]
MLILRSAASILLRVVSQYSPTQSREWAAATIRELDFIESDWEALRWAAGSTTALVGHWGHDMEASLAGHLRYPEELLMKDIRKKTLGTMSGIGIALALALAAFGVYALAVYLVPSLHTGVPWPAWIMVIAVPETIFAICVVKMWQRKRYQAVGILLAAMVLATHFAIHIAGHWND